MWQDQSHTVRQVSYHPVDNCNISLPRNPTVYVHTYNTCCSIYNLHRTVMLAVMACIYASMAHQIEIPPIRTAMHVQLDLALEE